MTTEENTTLERFATLDDLLRVYALRLHVVRGVELDVAQITAKSAWTYNPLVYRGGYVIPEFGYSVERIGSIIPAARAGHPELVRRMM